jgi:integrase
LPTFRKLSENNARSGFFSRASFDAVVAALPNHLRDVTLFAYNTGWRCGEIRGLTAVNVDMKLGELRISDSKNGDGRQVGPLTSFSPRCSQRAATRRRPGRRAAVFGAPPSWARYLQIVGNQTSLAMPA